MRKKKQSNTMLDQTRHGSTITTHPIDSLQDRCNKYAFRGTNTMKLLMQDTTIGPWNIYTLYVLEKEWTDMIMLEVLRATANRSDWRRLSVSSALKSPEWLKQSRELMMLNVYNMDVWMVQWLAAWAEFKLQSVWVSIWG